VTHFFFNGFNLSTLSSSIDNHSIHKRWDNLARLSTLTIENTVTLIEWIQKSDVSVAKAEWRELVVEIDNLLRLIDEKRLDPVYQYKFCGHYGSKADLDSALDQYKKIKMAAASVPTVKLCRVFFNRLCRITNSQPLTFTKPSMELESVQLKRLIKLTHETRSHIRSCAMGVIAHSCQDFVDHMLNLRGGMINFFRAIDEYWFLLLARNDPDVDQELTAENQRWLRSWTSCFFFFLMKAIGTVCFQ
jgi:hypothetical protein